MRNFIGLLLILIFTFSTTLSKAANVGIWDNNLPGWTSNFANGDPIDTGGAIGSTGASRSQIAVDSQGNVYTVFEEDRNLGQSDIYLTRYDGVDVRIWDHNTFSWTNIFANGAPINPLGGAHSSHLAIDSQDNVYITYTEGLDFYLNRFDGTDVRIWDNDTLSWTATLTDGDPINANTQVNPPRLAIDSQDRVYIAYVQRPFLGAISSDIYLSRYDGTDLRVWDHDTLSWSTILADGDPLNPLVGAAFVYDFDIGIDSNDNVYFTYELPPVGLFQSHIYLNRYDGTDVRIWDHDTLSWTTTFADGDNISPANSSINPKLAINSRDYVYVVYSDFTSNTGHIYLNRYDGADVSVWDHSATNWTTTLANGESIDDGGVGLTYSPQIATDTKKRVYLTYTKVDGGGIAHIYLNQYKEHPTSPQLGIWDHGISNWTPTLADADPIDTGNPHHAANSQIAIDSKDRVYVTYAQEVAPLGDLHIYLTGYTRKMGGVLANWDVNTSSWSTTPANGDPIDDPNGGAPSLSPPTPPQSHFSQLVLYRSAMGNRQNLFVTYDQVDTLGDTHIYLDRGAFN